MLSILMLIVTDCHDNGYCNPECSYSDILLCVFMLIVAVPIIAAIVILNDVVIVTFY